MAGYALCVHTCNSLQLSLIMFVLGIVLSAALFGHILPLGIPEDAARNNSRPACRQWLPQLPSFGLCLHALASASRPAVMASTCAMQQTCGLVVRHAHHLRLASMAADGTVSGRQSEFASTALLSALQETRRMAQGETECEPALLANFNTYT